MTAVLFLGVQFHCFWLLLPFSIHRKLVWLLRVTFHLGPQTWNTDEPHMHDWRCRSWVPLSTSAAKFISRSLSVFFNSFVKWYYCNGFHYTLVHIHGRSLNLTRLALKIVSVSIETFTSTWSSTWQSPVLTWGCFLRTWPHIPRAFLETSRQADHI